MMLKKLITHPMKWILWGCILLLLILTPRFTLAQTSTGLESRLSRLESESFSVRSQLNRLESQVYRLSNQLSNQQPGIEVPEISPAEPPLRNSGVLSSDDPQFDRLATLVVELKLQVNEIEERLAQVEAQLTP